MNNLKIYQIKKYNLKKDKYIEKCGNIIYLCNKLEKNKSYHLMYTNEEKCIIFGDIDHIKSKNVFQNILTKLCIYFNINNTDISYTLSKKQDEFSYHFSIPKYFTFVKKLKEIITHFKNKYSDITEYIDLSIYNNNSLFRLPNQSNENKQFIHNIEYGLMQDFIITYIPINSEEYIYNNIPDIPDIFNNIPNNIISNNTFNISEEQLKLFNMLNISHFDDRTKWINIGCLVYSLYDIDGYFLFLELSKKSKKFVSEYDVEITYNSFNKKMFTIATLHYYAKIDNPEEYNKLIKKKIIKKNDNDIIEISNRYLLDINDNLNNNDDILVKNINDFFKNDEIKSLNIKSPYDTGKTQLLKKIITKFNPKRILFVSYRISLTNDLLLNFSQFKVKSYLNNDYNADRLIIQLESLTKINNNQECFIDENTTSIPSYDLVIIDEIESVLNQFSSTTFNGSGLHTFNYLEQIIYNSKKLITLDGDLNDRAYTFINNFGKSLNIVNNIKINQRIYNVITDDNLFLDQIFSDLDNNKKIVIVSQSRRKVEDYTKIIKEKYEELTVLSYTSLTNDFDKMNLDVNKHWKLCDVLIYSPTIESGVNFDIIHFDKMYGILCNQSTSQRSYLRMLARIRKLNNNEITILSDKMFKLNEINNYINYDDELVAIKLVNSFKMEIEYKIINNQRVKICKYDNYTINYLHNKVESSNKASYYFLSKFKELVEEKGHIFNYNDKKDEEIEIYEKETNELYNEINNARLINYTKYCDIEQQKKIINVLEMIKYYLFVFITLINYH